MEQPGTTRLEAFSDGVLAVILTIMVLELKVPHTSGPAGLCALAPALAAYLLSFLFIGIYWINHHYLVDRLRRVSTAVLWANLGLLFALSLLPFFTGYLIDKHFDSFSVAIYAVSLLFSATMFQVLSYSIRREQMLESVAVPEADQRQHRRQLFKGWFSAGLYCAGFVVAWSHPRVAMSLLALVTVIWIAPDFGTVTAEECLDAHRQPPAVHEAHRSTD